MVVSNKIDMETRLNNLVRWYLVLILCALTALGCNAQSLVCTEGLSILESDLSARTNPRLDQNGEITAVIKVHSTLSGLRFVSTYIVGDIAYEAGQYTIYIAQGAKNIEVFKEGYIPCKVIFSDKSNIKYVQSQTTYRLVIGEVQQLGALSVTSLPSGAEVWFDDEYIGETPLKSQVQIGKHKVSIKKDRYAQIELVADIKEGKETVFNEKMSIAVSRLTINTDESSSIYIDEQFVGLGKYSGEQTCGTHNIKVTYKDDYIYREKTTSVKMQSDKVVDIYLLGSLKLNESKQSLASVTMYISGKNGSEKSKQQSIYSSKISNLYGTYKITTQRDGYWPEKEQIRVGENETVEYTIPKLRKNQRLMFLNYQFSPKAMYGGMLGWCNKWGVYVSGRANVELKKGGGYLFGINGWCINAGPMVRCTSWLYLNLGVGYCTYNSLNSVDFTQVDTKGFDAEIGLNFVVRGFTINVGYNTICSKDIVKISPLSNITAGIGFAL